MELLGNIEDPFCHLQHKGARSSGGDLAGWDADGVAQNCVCHGSPSSPAFLGQAVLSPRLTACFVTLTRYLIVCGLAKIQIVRRLRL